MKHVNILGKRLFAGLKETIIKNYENCIKR